MFEYDHAVVGAGIVGSWTALQLVRQGKKVVLLEQFSSVHPRGSSTGLSRIIRSVYEEECFARLMPHAFRMWHEAEAQADTALMQRTGILYVATSEESMPLYEMSLRNMEKYCPEALRTDADAIAEVMMGLLRYEGGLRAALLDTSAGVLRADKCLLAVQSLFRQGGGDLWDQSRVRRIEPVGGERVELHLDSDRSVSAQSVVVCAGAWTQRLLQPFVSIPAEPQVVKVFYWKEKEPRAYSGKSGFPALYDPLKMYSLPSLEYPGLVKVCLHVGEACDPEARDRPTSGSRELETRVREYVKEHFPLLEAEEGPAVVETCIYSMTPDEKFIIDFVPNHKNIVIGTGFSGTGFKTAPVVGRLLAEMATGAAPFLDTGADFRLSRFEG